MLRISDWNVAYLSAIDALKEYAADTPDIHFGGYLGRIGPLDEDLGRQVPIGARALRRQIHAILRIVVVLVHLFAQAEVGDLYLATVLTGAKQDVACIIIRIIQNHE